MSGVAGCCLVVSTDYSHFIKKVRDPGSSVGWFASFRISVECISSKTSCRIAGCELSLPICEKGESLRCSVFVVKLENSH